MPCPAANVEAPSNPPMMATMTTPAMAHHQWLTKFEMLSNIRVGSGSFALSDAKNVTNLGITKVARTMTDDDRHDRDDGGVDQAEVTFDRASMSRSR